MAAGKAIVSTAVDGCREVLEDGVTGLLVPPADAAALASGPRPRRWATPRCARRLGARAPRGLAPLRRARLRATRCRPSTTTCCSAGELSRCRCAASAAARARRGRCRATCCSAATPPSSPAGRCPRGDVPVFVFHSLEPESFARKLDAPGRQRLRHALGRRVRRASCGAQRAARAGGACSPSTTDAASVWSVGRAAAAAARHEGGRVPGPGRIVAVPAAGARLGRRRGRTRARPSAVLGAREGEGALLSWEEIDALARGGLFDFQSHTLSTRASTPGPQLAGFVTPAHAARLRRLRPAAGPRRRAGPAGSGRAARHAALALGAAHVRGAALLRGPELRAACVARGRRGGR